MAFGTLELTLRPLRLALLVDPADTDALTEAIQINTFLWGGTFNPIIPVFRRLPAVWRERFHGHLTAQTLVSGYLDAFDPDFVVTVGKVGVPKSGVGFREAIPSSEVLSVVEEYGTSKYGISLLEVLNDFAEKELKFVRQHPLTIRLPEWSEDFGLFFSATFGLLPGNLDGWFRRNYASLPGLKWEPCSLDTFASFLNPKNLFLRRLGNLEIERKPPVSFPRRDCIFVLDAAKEVDIIDYWNLRAAGWNIVPAPKQALRSEELQQTVCDFIVEHCYPLRGNPAIINTATLLKSRCCSENEMEGFWRSLKDRKVEHPERMKIAFQNWQPPIWDEWARECNHVQCAELQSNKSTQNFHDLQNFKGFTPVAPSFAFEHSGHEKPRFANRIEFRAYGSDEPLAEAIPEAEQELERAFELIGDEEFRFSRHGPIYLARHTDWPVHISIPKAEDIFRNWLEQRGWMAQLSDKGYVAKQMLRQLGGVWGVQALADEGTLSLMARMQDGKGLSAHEFRGELNRICNKRRRPFADADKLSKRLVELRAVQLGLELQCPHCRQYSWHSVKEADYEVGCPKCLQKFDFPSHAPKEMTWAYRSTGPFSLPQRAYGVYTVLLTLRFFGRLLKAATTPFLSFTAKKASAEMEADLALFFQESMYGQKKTSLIFAECKTNNEFVRVDAERMSALGEQFPGAVLVFATLNKTLTRKEQEVLRPVARRGRKRWKTGHPFNSVLILTGTELFAHWSPSQAWRDIGGRHAGFASYNTWPRGELLTLCDATQQLYLDLPPGDLVRRKKHRKNANPTSASENSSVPPQPSSPDETADGKELL